VKQTGPGPRWKDPNGPKTERVSIRITAVERDALSGLDVAAIVRTVATDHHVRSVVRIALGYEPVV